MLEIDHFILVYENIGFVKAAILSAFSTYIVKSHMDIFAVIEYELKERASRQQAWR